MSKLLESDLIINPDGSIYHLNLQPGDIAGTIITVGDPERIPAVTKYFDSIELKKGKREFLTETGYLNGKRLTVISTGIGTDNIDIVLNELDALANVDFESRTVRKDLTSLNIIRIGTSGAVQDDIPMGTILASEFAIGLDALMFYYKQQNTDRELHLLDSINDHFKSIPGLQPYLSSANTQLLELIGKGLERGITVTAPGFYGPQGRNMRAQNTVLNLVGLLTGFQHEQHRITNLEMETAGIYAMAGLLGHKALSINAILASRVNAQFSKDPNTIVDKAIKMVLERITQLPD